MACYSVRESLKRSSHAYSKASRIVYEWTEYAAIILDIYLNSIENKKLAIAALDDGVDRITVSLNLLDQVIKHLDEAHSDLRLLSDYYDSSRRPTAETFVAALLAGLLAGPRGGMLGANAILADTEGTVIYRGITVDNIDEALELIQKFYNDSTEKVQAARNSTVSTKEAIKTEVLKMVELKADTRATKSVFDIDNDNIRNELEFSVSQLISQCEEYRRRWWYLTQANDEYYYIKLGV